MATDRRTYKQIVMARILEKFRNTPSSLVIPTKCLVSMNTEALVEFEQWLLTAWVAPITVVKQPQKQQTAARTAHKSTIVPVRLLPPAKGVRK